MNLDDYKMLNIKEVKSSLQETSKDTSDGEVKYMTSCNLKVINFDRVKTRYLNMLGLSEEKAKSIDALCQMKNQNDDGIYMIEFKNGKVKPRDIEMKTRDSLLVFQSITDKQLEYVRNNVRFILVYNKECNDADFRTKKALLLARKGKIDYTQFGLANLRDYCFKDVIAYSKEEFEDEFVSLLK